MGREMERPKEPQDGASHQEIVGKGERGRRKVRDETENDGEEEQGDEFQVMDTHLQGAMWAIKLYKVNE